VHLRKRISAASLVMLISGCTLGPDFHRPKVPATDRYTPGDVPELTAAVSGDGGTAQRFVNGGQARGRWWELFQCPALNALVDEALSHSPTVLQAQARLREAQADLRAQFLSAYFPALDGQFGVTREKVDPAAFGIPNIPSQPPFTLYNAQVNVSYTLDLFGAERRLVESARAQAEYTSYQSAATKLTLAANVVSAAIRQADLQAQIEYTEQIIAARRRELIISEERYTAGGISLQELQKVRSDLAQVTASLPPLKAQRQALDHQLAVYTGVFPAAAAIPQFRLRDLQLPTEIPVALPSELVRQRPDVQASEALWHEAAADLGVATANLFPHLSISGSAGSERTQASQIVDGVNVWSIGASLMQPIFHAGELRAKRQSAAEAYEAAAQAYEQTVLESLQQVADSLRVLESDASALQARTQASEESAANFNIAQQRYAAGGISEYSLLDVQREKLQASLDQEHARAQRYIDTATLLHALAGNL
jgi:NodT family efflux transporter outer membrane factor (OMF) lipoprotein